MATETATNTSCPSSDRLRGLIDSQLPTGELAVLTDHVGGCAGCQGRMEDIASDGDKALSGSLRHIDKSMPSTDSAYWPAINKVEAAVTDAFIPTPPTNGKAKSTGELKLDFLDPPTEPGYIGKLGAFGIKQLLGRGGMGAVFLGHDDSLGRDVAVKILDPQLANQDIARQRFCREARAAASVSHENIVAVYQVAEEKSGLPYMVMQLVNGETLEQRLRRVGKLSVVEAVRIGAQAAAGLAAAHGIGLIHRDIKPGNILIESGTNKAKLTDFGLARAAEDLKLTRTGFVAGTPLYMAPEQARGEEVDSRGDLFALGAVLYESLAGKPPFEGTTPLAVLRRIADDEHPRLRRLNREVPDWLEDVIDQLLAKNPKDRFQSAQDVADVLSLKLKCLDPTAIPVAAPCIQVTTSRLFGRWRRRKVAAVALIAGPMLVGGLAGGLGAWYSLPREVVTVNVPVPGELVAVAAAPIGPDALAELKSDSGPVWSVSATKDGKTIAVGQEDGTIKLWNVETKQLVRTLTAEVSDGHRGPVWAVALSPDGKTLVSGGDDSRLLEWDLTDEPSKKPKKPKEIEHPSSVRAVAVNWKVDPIWVATGDRTGLIQLFNLGETIPVKQFEHGASVTSITFADDPSMTVVSAGTDKKVVAWEVPTQRRRFELTGHKGPVYAVATSSDGSILASASWDGKVILWDMNGGSMLKSLEAHEDGVWALDFSCCGKMLATGGQDGLVKVWNADTGAVMRTFARHRGVVHAVKFSEDGSRLFTGGRDGTVRVWQVTH